MKRHAMLGVLIALSAGCLGACSEKEPAPGETGPQQSSQPSPAGHTEGSGQSEDSAQQPFPDVLKAELSRDGGSYMIAVTISSPYDTPERYADGWRVTTPDGEVLAEHTLAHDHANEQPFTRTRGPFEIPEDVTEVIVEGRDLVNGYGGETVTVTVPR